MASWRDFWIREGINPRIDIAFEYGFEDSLRLLLLISAIVSCYSSDYAFPLPSLKLSLRPDQRHHSPEWSGPGELISGTGLSS